MADRSTSSPATTTRTCWRACASAGSLPQFIATNRLEDAPGYDEVRRLGLDVVKTLGLGTTATHMEWFYGAKGLKFSEIGCRPPGVGAWDLYCAGNEMDVYGEWARAIVELTAQAAAVTAFFAAGMIALRPDRDGCVTGYSGLDVRAQERFEPSLIDSHLPPVGTPTQPVEAGFMANAWMRFRHPELRTPARDPRLRRTNGPGPRGVSVLNLS